MAEKSSFVGRVCLFFLFLFVFTQSSFASSSPVRILLNGQELASDAPVVIENDRTLAPLRNISEALGARVDWEETNKTVTVSKNDLSVKLGIGNQIAYLNGKKMTLDVPAKIIGNRTMVPVRFLNETLGAIVQWNPVDRVVEIKTPVKLNGELVVQGDQVNIRSGPGLNHDILLQVSRGARLPVLEKSSNWYKVQLAEGNAGWIIAWYAKEESSLPSSTKMNTNEPETKIILASNEEVKKGIPPEGQNEVDNNEQVEQGKDNKNEQQEEEPVPDEKDKQRQGITLTIKEENETTIVKVAGDQHLTYNIFSLREPERLVLDIYGVSPGNLPTTQNINSKTVNMLRVGWFSRDPDVTRLVFDLKEQAFYKTEISADQKNITLNIFIPNLKSILNGKTIIFDPGHGGSDPGAIGNTLGLKEKDINLDVARNASRLLSSYGAKVILTRNNDEYIDLNERVRKANSVRADLFVSIHMNANTSPLLKGTSTYYALQNKNNECLQKSRSLAEYIQKSLVSKLGTEDKGVRQADFVVLRETSVPSVLLEAAFISNPNEEKLMATEKFREKIAQAIVQGIGNYLTSLMSP